jgi:hypothetical protein
VTGAGFAESPAIAAQRGDEAPRRSFRFYDNRQKYLLFVNTCAEKSAVAHRIAQALLGMCPTPPAGLC